MATASVIGFSLLRLLAHHISLVIFMIAAVTMLLAAIVGAAGCFARAARARSGAAANLPDQAAGGVIGPRRTVGARGRPRWWLVAWLVALVTVWAVASAVDALLYPRRPQDPLLVWLDAFAEPLAVVAGAALGMQLVRHAMPTWIMARPRGRQRTGAP